MKGQGDALMGIGMGSGDTRAKDAADKAIDNPLLEDTSIEGATRLLVNIAGPEDISMIEVREIMDTIRAKTDPGAIIKQGITFDPDLGENIKVTVIATGFHSKGAAQALGENSRKKAEASDIIIDYKRFDEMRGMRDKRTNDNYVGILKSRDYNENLEVPTAIRKYNPDSDSGQAGKTAPVRKDA
jgi:cell division protein FtsZ